MITKSPIKLKLLSPMLVFLLWAPVNAATVSIDPTVRYQVFDGFGEGTMDQFTEYYYQNYPSSSLTDYLNKLYTLNDNGLGLAICRIPIPVGDAAGHPHHWKFNLYGGRPPEALEPEENIFDWNGYGQHLWKAQGASARGAKMWAYWYSMPYWLTVSGCTSGNGDGTANNLPSGKESRFATHICDILEHFHNVWNVEFDYVSVLNEPESDWWDYWGGQPGCHMSSNQAVMVYEALKTQLPAYNVSPDFIAYDSAYTNTVNYLNALLSSSIEADLSKLACHQYITSEWALKQWAYLRSRHEKSLWMTEWGDWTNAQYPGYTPGGDVHLQMMNYANKIHEALAVLKANGWVMWEPEFIFDSQTQTFQPRKAYWAIAQYSRHVRPGMQMIHAASSNSNIKTTAWLGQDTPDGQELILVTVNSGTSALTVDYDFSLMRAVQVQDVYRTSSSQSYSHVNFSLTSSVIFNLTLPAESITTIIAKIPHCSKLQADITEDCFVEMQDFIQIAQAWLLSGLWIADVSGDGEVDMEDVAVLSHEWLDFRAFAPAPADGDAGVNPVTQLLQWAGHVHAIFHDIYLGTSFSAVQTAGNNSPEYKGRFSNSTYVPSLAPNTTYYWRIDEVNSSDIVCRGDMWTFSTSPAEPDESLMGYWKMDENNGSVAEDSSIYDNNGTLRGNPVWRPSSGKYGGAIELDGSGDAVEISGFSLTGDTATFTAWVNCYQTVPWAGIVYSRSGSACGMHYENVNRLRYTWNDNDVATWGWNSGLTIPGNEWVFVGLVIQPDRARLYAYADSIGLQEVEHELPNMIQMLDNLKIGWDSQSSDRYFHGMIDEVRIYQRALLREEILDLIH